MQFYFSLDRDICETGPAKATHVLKTVVLWGVMWRSLLLNGCLNTKYSGYSTKVNLFRITQEMEAANLRTSVTDYNKKQRRIT